MLRLFTKENVLILSTNMEHGLYFTTFEEFGKVTNYLLNQIIQLPISEPMIPMALSCNLRALRLIHKRLGHISEDRIKQMMKLDLVNLPNEQVDSIIVNIVVTPLWKVNQQEGNSLDTFQGIHSPEEHTIWTFKDPIRLQA